MFLIICKRNLILFLYVDKVRIFIVQYETNYKTVLDFNKTLRK